MTVAARRNIEVVEIRFQRPAPALSENQARGMHWAEVRRRLEPWAEAVRMAWLQAGPEKEQIAGVPCKVEMHIPFTKVARRDPHNFVGTIVKAAVDVLVRFGPWPDDSPEWVEIVDPRIVIGDEGLIRLIPRLAESDALGTRAVLRPIAPGNSTLCVGCRDRLNFKAWKERKTRQQVICNVYESGVWNRVEHWHPPCYKDAGEPYGRATA